MPSTPAQGEPRLAVPPTPDAAAADAAPFVPDPGSPVPLRRLRSGRGRPVPPEACRLGPDCQVCRWRRDGLLPPAGPSPTDVPAAAVGPSVPTRGAARP